MGVSIEVYRARIGAYNGCRWKSSSSGQRPCAFGLLLKCFAAAVVLLLLLSSGIEPNPGPAFTCKYCGLVFDTAPKYCEHVQVHKMWKNFTIPCCFCLRQLGNVKSFQTHVWKFHSDRTQQEPTTMDSTHSVLNCPVVTCQKKLDSRKVYLKHMADHLRSGEFFACPLCPEVSEKPRPVQCDLKKFRVHTSRYHQPSAALFGQTHEVNLDETFTSEASAAEVLNECLPDQDDDENFSILNDVHESVDDPFPDHVIKDEIARFYLKLEGEHLLPTSVVQTISEEIKLISELSHHCLKRALREELKKLPLDENLLQMIVNNVFKCDPIFNTHHKSEDVDHLGTHHLRSKYWQKRYPYVEPREIIFGPPDLNGVRRRGHYVSIRGTLNTLLRDEQIKKMVLASFTPPSSSSTGVLQDFTDGSAFERHRCEHHNGKCLQLLMFQDAFDFTAFAPSAGKYKPLGFYYNIGNLPPEYRSKVDLIQMVYIVLEKYLKPSEQEELQEVDLLKEALAPLLTELKDLKINGINIDGENIPVCLLFLIGDSLGQHQVGGFIRSFSDEFFCRFCPMTRTEFRNRPHALKPLRTPQSYDSAVQTAKLKWNQIKRQFLNSKKKRAEANAKRVAARCTAPGKKKMMKKGIINYALQRLRAVHFKGVKYYSSPFNSSTLKFHVSSPALPPCLAHDLFEGSVKIVLARALKYFIDKGWFDFACLNRRIKQFKCHGSDARDAPQPLKKLDKLTGSACQTWNFLRLLPFIIGDLIQDNEDKVWRLCLTLKEICEFICAPKITLQQVAYLQSLISLYLSDLKELNEYLPDVLIPKQHFLRHYPDLIAIFGPLIRLFTLRYESKHCFFKQVVRNCRNYINITYTLAKKYMCKFAYDHSAQLIPPDVVYDPKHVLSVNPNILSGEQIEALPEDFDFESTEILDKVTVKGVEYNIRDSLILGSEDVSDLVVGSIEMIFLSRSNSVSFLFKRKIAENSHNGYYRILNHGPDRFLFANMHQLLDYYPLPSYNYCGQECFALKHSVTYMI